jgi:short-subunit dehydrogenase
MIIIITGASKGIGKSIAIAFAKPNNILILCARNAKDSIDCTNEIYAICKECTTISFNIDVTNLEEIAKFSQACLQIGTPDILINNAGSFVPGSIFNEPDGVLQQMLSINLMSAYNLTRLLLPSMMAAKAGHIFNICSIASTQAYSNGGSYSISKFALLGFSKNLREELKPYNIKVTSVLPGATYTNSWANSGVETDRIMEANDIATMVVAASQLSPQACVEEIVMRPQLGDL